MAQLLLTRGKDQNIQLQQLLGRPDVTTFSLCLLLPKPIELSHESRTRLLNLDQFDEIVFISKNAVAYGVPQLEHYWPQWPISLRWFAVGATTASALLDQGIDSEYPNIASSEGLLALPSLKQVDGHRTLIVRGVGGRETLKQGLRQRGAQVEYLEVYERNVQYYAAHDFPMGSDVVALLYSGEAITHLFELIGKQALQYTLVVPSKRLKQLALDIGFETVELAENQEDDAMVESLVNILRHMA